MYKKPVNCLLILLLSLFISACTNTKDPLPKKEESILYMQMGVRYLEMGMLKIAKENLEMAVEVDSNNADTEPPLIVSWNISPEIIDVSSSSEDVIFQINITDDSGVNIDHMANARLINLNASSETQYANLNLISGDIFDGIYEAVFSVPQGSLAGEWAIGVMNSPGIQDIYGQASFLHNKPFTVN